MSAIFCGVGGQIIQKLSNMLFEGFNKLFEVGMEIDDIKKETDDDGNDVLQCQIRTGGDRLLRVKMTRLKDDRWDMIVQGEDGKKQVEENIRPEEADEILTDLIDKWYGETYEGRDDGEDLFKDVKKSAPIQIGLKKVQATNSFKVTRVCCSADNVYDAIDAIDILKSDEDFIHGLPSKEVEYDISYEDADSIDIAECESPQECNCFAIIMSACDSMLSDISTIKWNFNKSCNCEEYCVVCEQEYNIRYVLDTMAELSCECFGCAPDYNSLRCCNKSLRDTTNGFDMCEASAILAEDATNIIDTLLLFYTTVPSDIQMLFDQYVRDLKRYKLTLSKYCK